MALNKVLFINYSYAYGSTGRLVQDIGAALEKQGVETYYACKKATAHHKNLYMIGNKFVHLCAGLHSRVSGLQGYSCTAATQALITFMDQLKPDVIHLHNLHGNYINIHILFRWLSKQNCKIVWTLHDCWPFTGNCAYFNFVDRNDCNKWKDGTSCKKCPDIHRYPPSWFFDRGHKMFRDKAALYPFPKLHIVTVSHWLEKQVKQSMLKECDVRTIYNWINLETFTPAATKASTDRYKQKVLLLAIASDWSREKGIKEILDVAEQLQDRVGFILVGNCRKQWKKPLSNVYYEGPASQSEIVKLYNICDAVLSLATAETFGLTVAEGLACGKPAIVRNVGACPEVSGNCGVHLDTINAESILDAIQVILKQDGNMCRERAQENFSTRNIQQYLDLYRSI